LIPLESYQFVDIIGPDSDRFLQGQLTTSIEDPSENEAFLSSVCNPKGRIVSLFHIVKIAEGYRLLIPRSNVENSIAHFKKYAVFFKVTVSPVSLSIFAVVAKKAQEQTKESPVTKQLNLFKLSGTDLTVFTRDSSNNDFDLDNEMTWFEYLAEHKIAWIDEQTSEQYLPHDLNLPKLKAVNFNKGCFTGQEVIARMQYKGKLKQHISLLISTESQLVEVKTPLYQGEKKVGNVICSTATNEKGCLVLALVKDKADKAEVFQLNTENGPILRLIE
jgi:folate-binding protein YgfZ